jgi:hypothetical protein
LEPLLEHPAQHGAGHKGIHLQADDLASAQPRWDRVWVVFEPARQPFDNRRFANAGLAEEHH